MMTDEEFASKITNIPLPVIATGLLKLESERESALDKACKEIELDPLKLSDEERRKQFGGRVRMMRQLLGLTQADLAKKIGVTNQAIATYEKGKREATYKNLIGLSRALSVTTDWLLGEPPHKKEFQLQ